MRTLTKTTGALVAAAACSLLLAPAAYATTDTYTVDLHQKKELPLTATSWTGDKEKTCADIPADKDGWHFVLPGKTTDFVKLTVTFEKGGEQVITDFGPPSDKHAFASSEAGDTLTSAVAEVKGGEVKWFNLSHTCPASVTTSPSPSTSPSQSPTAIPSGSATPTQNPTGSPTGSPSATPSENPTGSATPGGTAPTASPSTGGSSTGDLAETGSSAPVGALAGVAAALVAGGAFLVVRRRKAQQH
ncbi:LPXTG cell wall anchor domain-containing protein [Streptomyces coeruleoprunus]|uniref:LPXTG cell wall anchor domain-containing protein n=1 Tax=Streptomyces coeruleoprunus TaxID=285563 RepID=A0ABV9XI90_9ACTN